MDYAEEAYQQEETGQEVAVSFRRIEELEQYGVNKTDITKLKAGGYHTVESVSAVDKQIEFIYVISYYIFFIKIAHSTIRKLVEVKGISDQKAQKLKEIIKSQQLVSLGFTTATDRLNHLKDTILVSTGIDKI